MKARTLDRAYVNKYVRPTVVRLNKAEAFLAIEPVPVGNLIRLVRAAESRNASVS